MSQTLPHGGATPPVPAAPRPPATLRPRWRALLAGALALAGTACTTLPGPPLVQDEAGCHAFTALLDGAITRAQVADAEAERIDGFPGLRVDRLGEALRVQARNGGAAFAAWVEHATRLDQAARAAELANLPDAAFPLGPPGAGAETRARALARSDECRQHLVQRLTPPLQQALLERATVPARYSTAYRALGLYPLVRWPFFAGVQGWQSAQAADMARWATQAPPLQRHEPEAGALGLDTLAGSPAREPPPWPPALDALGLPRPTPAQAERLLAWHAPVFETEVRGAFDRFGSLAWTGAAAPQVEPARPVVFHRLSHTRWQGRWLLQLNYTLWFPERPARSAFDLLAGALVGVKVRLTLDEQGRPLLVDTIHACGCYHLFFPGAGLVPREGAPEYEEWLFAPAPLPALPPSHRLVVRLASSTHYVMGLDASPRRPPGGTRPAQAGAHGFEGPAAQGGPAPGSPAVEVVYTLLPEDTLRSLPAPEGRRSLYGPDGLVAGTGRGERFFFWPMGIASAGAMRQWGHHATAFVGRRHFDEPDLIERRFEPAPR